ncbi:TIGR02452 family protein [Anaerotruncus colihominis]|uniref:TIGR02452 family protein n=1 Tax=Anaerotruncus colihominis TaxID=169435 RepID=A0A845RKQ7_9FIRM|nr:TIGR02452 family protein [Anaerotruncus colihominis]NBI78292.1 TIGR02452 family protein [Anaerotruncus colihominis]
MNRKAIANETLRILEQGWYEYAGERIEIADMHQASLAGSRLITPETQPALPPMPAAHEKATALSLRNCSAVRAVIDLRAQGAGRIGVLNFASAKNPGGGFLNGAMAQEESIAASSGLYRTQTIHPEYYARNRACGTMCYTDCAIYSPDVVFFRDEWFALLERPVTASVLTLPAVNFGQALIKGEDAAHAKRVMKTRMRLALTLFAAMGDENLVLGAYGCGVFRNDPEDIAAWWASLLTDADFKNRFSSVTFAVLDRSKSQTCYRAFERRFGTQEAF